MSKKRIAFFDYRLDNFHADVYLSAIRGPLAERGYRVCGATALDAQPSEAWCKSNDVPYFVKLEDLAAQADFLAILAPSNPELHLQMCQRAFPLKKTTFVDKTFAPDSQTARAIFELADEHNISVQSTSALRSTNVQEFLATKAERPQSMIAYASGPTFAEYGIHPFELVVSCMGADVTKVSRVGNREFQQYIILFSDSRTAVVNFHEGGELPFSAALLFSSGCEQVSVNTDTLFVDAAASFLDFFDAGRELIDRQETLVIRAMLDFADQDSIHDRFVELDGMSVQTRAVPAPHWPRSAKGIAAAEADEVQVQPEA